MKCRRTEGSDWTAQLLEGIHARGGKADDMVFDNVLEGGIMVSAEQRAKWKNVFHGQHNLAEPDKLYWDLNKEGPQEIGNRVK